MEKRLKSYLAAMEKLTECREKLRDMDTAARRQTADELLVQIQFFQHERLVHLIVTVTFAILTLLSILGCVLAPQPAIFALVALLLVLLVPYIRHYYILENGVQKLYVCYDRLAETCSK
ncbi:MAG: hypothetical protein HDR02_11765 [Lachnospiraceae bacterium]|nr:hypothetical protein [Lachnospiraceae bacterium]